MFHGVSDAKLVLDRNARTVEHAIRLKACSPFEEQFKSVYGKPFDSKVSK